MRFPPILPAQEITSLLFLFIQIPTDYLGNPLGRIFLKINWFYLIGKASNYWGFIGGFIPLF